ncbi:hypothetical protein [Cytobacillus sp.]|uniref:hypothetical protein n=1 Tax=Cytobacillus sp. TaxID=2675269 RepID=UPI0028BE3895|nr:hypothetical protein [Cytobacillus sp.]
MKKVLIIGAITLSIFGLNSGSASYDQAGIPSHHVIKPVTEVAGIPSHHSAELISTFGIPSHH